MQSDRLPDSSEQSKKENKVPGKVPGLTTNIGEIRDSIIRSWVDDQKGNYSGREEEGN